MEPGALHFQAGSPPAGAFDVVLVGGGLQNALIALAMLHFRPEARVAMVERAARIGGNHTWSFHAGDLPEAARPFVEPLVVRRWPGYDVAFPGFERALDEPYASISSDRLASVVEERFRAAPGAVLHTGVAASRIEASAVTLASGQRLEAPLVVDARGPEGSELARVVGYQKFVGLELQIGSRTAPCRPTLMDACVPQTDGFRFFYTLPLGEQRVLVEDTYFSDTPDLDVPALRAGILDHARRKGLEVRGIGRQETGVLPLPGRVGPRPGSASPLSGGYAGGWFHPATGYSFPVALRIALHVATTPPGEVFGPSWERLVARHRTQFRFGGFLNRLLFSAFAPEDRWNALARFYRAPAESVRRFYAMETTFGDRLRVVCGRPPQKVSISAALFRGAPA
jgi:lycopene beta-cyclase